MPTNSTNFNIPKPVASDAFNLTNFNLILDAIDTNIKVALTGVGGNAKDVSNLDLNNITNSGFYRGSNVTNAPTTGAFHFIITNYDANANLQMAFSTGIDVFYVRRKSAQTWSAWVQLETTTGAQTKATTAENNAINFAKGFGLGDIAKDVSGTDLNNLDATGFYKGNSLSNAPITGTSNFYFVVNLKHNSTSKSQIAVPFTLTSNLVLIRTNNSGTWSAWTQLATYDATGKVAAANLPSASTSSSGISQLVDSITDTSTNKAATANSVKLVVDWAKGFGLGASAVLIDATDLNTLDNTGFYRGASLVNPPVGTTTGGIIHIKYDSQTAKQIFYHSSSEKQFTRSKTIGTWGAWSQIVIDQTTTWTNLTLQNSWVNSGGTDANASYRLNAIGEIELRGAIKNGNATSGTQIAILPAGFRPTSDHTYTVASSNGTAYIVGIIQIQSSGIIRILSGANTFLSFDSIPPIEIN